MAGETIDAAIRETYSRAAEAEQPRLCCSVDYRQAFSPSELAHLPQEVLAKNYGCGIPARLATLSPGQCVLDLGPGVGRDCFIAAAKVGSRGKVWGLDMNPDMLKQARKHAKTVADALGYANVEFLEGRFDVFIPLPSESVDVIISNCVNNLATDKKRAYREMHRVLKPGAALSFSDVVADEPNPEVLRTHAQAVADCIGGVQSFNELRSALADAGFVGMALPVEFVFRTGEEILKAYFDSGARLRPEERSLIAGRTYYSVNVLALKHKYDPLSPKVHAGHRALYSGPGRNFTLDEGAGQAFPAGEWIDVSTATAWLLAQDPYRAQFTVIGPEGAEAAVLCCGPACC